MGASRAELRRFLATNETATVATAPHRFLVAFKHRAVFDFLAEFEEAFLGYFDNKEEISRMKEAWKNIDNGYAEHIRAHFPEINLNQL